MKAPEKIDSFENLHLRIRTLGYPRAGESILISLMDKERSLYTVLIDSYKERNYNYWLTKLPRDTRIDAFVWTHPDEDHSLGVDDILNQFDPEHKASIFLPTSLTRKLLTDNKKHASLPCYNYLKSHYNRASTYLWKEISVTEDEEIRYCYKMQIADRENNDTVTFRLGFMLPNGSVVNRRVDKRKMNSGEMNHLSLFCVVELNKIRYIFSGDLAEVNIQFLAEDQLSNCRFIKIPHHGSKEPIKLIEKIKPLSSSPTHSVTTVFGASHPYDEVLKEYAKKFEAVFSTGRGNHPYGLVDINYSVSNPVTYELKLAGNAIAHSLNRILWPLSKH